MPLHLLRCSLWKQGPDQPFQIEGRRNNQSGDAQFRANTPDYFRAVRVPLLQDRFFTQADNPQSQGVVIINEALGAAHPDVLRLIVGQGMKVVAIGLALGIGLALLSTRLISSMLYGVRPTDAATLA